MKDVCKTMLASIIAFTQCVVLAASGPELFYEAGTREKQLRSKGAVLGGTPEYSALVESYSKALESGDLSKGERHRALVSRARLYAETGRCSLARNDLDSAIGEGHRTVTGYAVRAYCHVQAGSLEAARRDLDLAISINSKDPILYRERALVSVEQKNYTEAVSDFSRSIDLMKPARSSDLFVMRGDAYFSKSEYEHAIGDYSQAIRVTKENAAKLFKSELSSRSSSLRPLYEKLANAYHALSRASDPGK